MSNPMTFLPSLNMMGFYSLSQPYDKLISISSQYRCEGVKSLASAINEGLDPLTSVYLANGDTLANFEIDLANDVSLITISAESGLQLVFPSSALLKVPQADGIVYRNYVVTVALGAIAETEDLTVIQDELLDMVLNKFGVRGATVVTAVGAAAVLTKAQHEKVQLAREATVTDGEALIAKNARLTAERAQLLDQIQQLDAYIRAHLPAP